MRIYSFIFVLFVVFLFIINELLCFEVIGKIVFIFTVLNIISILIAYGFHRNFVKFIFEDLNRAAIVSESYFIDRRMDVEKLVISSNAIVPKYMDEGSHYINSCLEFSRKYYFLYNISKRMIDSKYIRCSWMKLKKANILDNIKKGDLVLYHREGSFIGSILRFVTRFYWEHCSIYIGNEKLHDCSPGGVREISLLPWIGDERVELCVLRPQFIDSTKIDFAITKTISDSKNVGYGYFTIILMFWDIITGNTRLGLMDRKILIANIFINLVILLFIVKFPEYIRLHILFFLLSSIYMFGSIHHKFVFMDNYKDIFSEIPQLYDFWRLKDEKP